MRKIAKNLSSTEKMLCWGNPISTRLHHTFKTQLLNCARLKRTSRSSVSLGMSESGAHGTVDRYSCPRTDTVNFDPTSMGLPAGWSLTIYSDLKG